MKSLLLFPVLLLSGVFAARDTTPDFIDPTGTYTLTGIVKNNRVITHSGEIRVLLLSDNRAALCLYINKGYPGYESGALMDTLLYDDNTMRYSPSADTTCTIIFRFTQRTVEIIKLYSNPHSGCGFSDGVLTSGIFQKTSADRPVIQDLSAHGASQ